MYWAFWICCLRSTEGLVNCWRFLNCLIVPVLSNLRLKRFSALSIFSPSLTGIINMGYNLLSLGIRDCKDKTKNRLETNLFQNILRDNHFLDFCSAFPDGTELGIPVKFLYGKILCVTIPTMDLDGFVRHFYTYLRCIHL